MTIAVDLGRKATKQTNKAINSFMYKFLKYVYIVYVKYWINSASVVAGVDPHNNALSMHIQKSCKEKSSHNCHFLKKI